MHAFGIEGAAFEGAADPETNFKLFGPVSAPLRGAKADRCTFAMRLRPNQCFHTALEEFAREKGLCNARIWGGVGSIIGAAFEDGSEVPNFATEIFISDGRIVGDAAGTHTAELDVGVVDYTGALAEGRLKRGANTILMTFELMVAES